jgi:hypothetical protein
MELKLHEEMLLLALRDEKGTLESRAGAHHYALAGAILSELVLAGRVDIDEDKKKLVHLRDRTSMGDEILDEALARVADSKKPRSAQDWVGRFAGFRRLRHRGAEGLCRRGVLKDSEDTVLLFFKRKVYPTIDPRPEHALRDRMHAAVFGESRLVEPRTAVVVALGHATGMLGIHLDKRKLKERKARIESIANGDLVGAATSAAAEAAQQAVLGAIIASSVITSTVINSS